MESLKSLMPSLDYTRAFLKQLTNNSDEMLTFQTFDDTNQNRSELVRVLHGTLDEHVSELTRLNRLGSGIFVAINKTDGKGRKIGNIIGIRASFADSDTGPITNFKLKPSIIVESKRGTQPYWCRKDSQSLTTFTQTQIALSANLGTDPAVSDLPRVMRLPGFFHLKDPKEPFLVKIKEVNPVSYTAEEILMAYPKIINELITVKQDYVREERAYEGSRNSFLFGKGSSFLSKGLSSDFLLQALIKENQENCSPPLSQSEIEGIANSLRKYTNDNSLISEPLTDIGNASRLVALIKNDFRYISEFKTWFHWDGKKWSRDTIKELQKHVENMLKLLSFKLKDLTDDSLRNALSSHIRSSSSASKVQSMQDLARAHLPLSTKELDKNRMLLNIENGILNLRTGELLPHDSKQFMSMLAPVIFDPAAKCPTFDAFLKRILKGDGNLMSFIQRAIGYSLTGLIDSQCMFIFYGIGANGKSTLIETVKFMLGDYAKQTDFSTFLATQNDKIRNDIARLAGARFVSTSEANEGRKLDEALIKQLTGGDTVSARFLYGEYFEYLPQFKLFAATNHKPVINGADEGIWRRLKLIPFTETIPSNERDPDLLNKLKAEMSGILNWAIEGCLEYQNIGLSEPDPVTLATSEYRVDQDIIGRFIQDCCHSGRTLRVKSSELYSEYQRWTSTNNETQITQKQFNSNLESRSYSKKRYPEGLYWIGLALK